MWVILFSFVTPPVWKNKGRMPRAMASSRFDNGLSSGLESTRFRSALALGK